MCVPEMSKYVMFGIGFVSRTVNLVPEISKCTVLVRKSVFRTVIPHFSNETRSTEAKFLSSMLHRSVLSSHSDFLKKRRVSATSHSGNAGRCILQCNS